MEDLPEGLSHRPIYAIPFEKFDGQCPVGTDVRYFSVGLAQWNHAEVSAKIMRRSGDRWSRQSEEIPLHRLIDLTTLVASVVCNSESGTVSIPVNTFAHQDEPLTTSINRNRTIDEIGQYESFLARNGDFAKSRLRILRDILSQLTEEGKL